MSTKETIIQILADQFGISTETIHGNSHLTNDLNADSLDMVEIVMEVENQFKIEISDEEYANCSTVDLIVELVDKKLTN